MKHVSLCNDHSLAGRPAECPCMANFKVAIFLDSRNMMNDMLCMAVVLIKFCLFILFAVILIRFQGPALSKSFI